jgi:hypothetical protein
VSFVGQSASSTAGRGLGNGNSSRVPSRGLLELSRRNQAVTAKSMLPGKVSDARCFAQCGFSLEKFCAVQKMGTSRVI